MNADKLNSWLALVANISVLTGIIVVVFELRQTQTAMRAEASTTRAEMFIENSRWGNEKNILAIYSKFNTGDILTEIEENNMRHSMRSQLRYFENLHYQWQLGVLDEEIWQTNLSGISAISRVPSFKFFYPDWPNGFEASTLRSSFVELISSLGE